MPVYEFRCQLCGHKAEVLARRVGSAVTELEGPAGQPGHRMVRIMSTFARRLTEADKLAEAEAQYGAEVEAVMGKGPDIARLARRYDTLSADLPPE